MVIGSGTTAAEELVIVDAFILAQGFENEPPSKCGNHCNEASAFGNRGAAGAFGGVAPE
jgi:hypothetical protein